MLVLKALNFATEKHKGQVSKDPYISHPLKVSYLLASFKQSKKIDELLCAALLHDTLEDTETSFNELAKEFTTLVAGLVFELTSDEDQIKLVGKTEYLKKKMVAMSSYALTLKLVDRLANMTDHPSDKSKLDTKEILTHVVDNRKCNGTQKRIIEEILKVIK
jgi:(p)ppGpp synthase/HD superfamily hydrolase